MWHLLSKRCPLLLLSSGSHRLPSRGLGWPFWRLSASIPTFPEKPWVPRKNEWVNSGQRREGAAGLAW